MKNYFKFYWRQSLKNIRKEVLSIIIISISISMVSGLSYYFEATQKNKFDEGFNFLPDFEIVHEQFFTEDLGVTPRLNYSLNFQPTNNKILKLLNESRLDIVGTYQYALLTMESAFFYNPELDHLDLNDMRSLFQYYTLLNASRIEFGFFNNSFYQSSRFQNYFKILEGEYPKTQKDILIDFNFAQKMNYQVGDIVNISLKIGRIHEMSLGIGMPIFNLFDFQLLNVSVSGFYLPKMNSYNIDNEDFYYSYTYEDYLLGHKYEEKENIDSPIMFSWYNFTEIDGTHPAQQLYYEIDHHVEAYKYLRNAFTRSGYIVFYNREAINYASIRSINVKTSQQADDLSIQIPLGLFFHNKLNLQLDENYRNLMENRLTIQLLNLPILFFSFLISQNIGIHRNKKKDKENLLLRLRGIPVRKIQNQIIVESIIGGMICTVVGIGGGLLTFYGYDYWFDEIFQFSEIVQLKPLINLTSIIQPVILGIIVNLLTKIPKIYEIRKSKYENISIVLNNSSGISKNDENAIPNEYYQNTADQVQLRINSQELLGNKLLKKIEKREKRQEKISNGNSLKFKYSLILVAIGALPLLAYAILFITNTWIVPDRILNASIFLYESVIEMKLLVMLCIGIFVAGCIRLALVMQPYNLTILLKKISKIFVGDLDEMISLEYIRQKIWSRIIIYIGIFAALLVVSNISYVSEYHYNIVDQNIDIGSDLQITTPLSPQDEELIHDHINNLKDQQNEEIVNDIVSFYYSSNNSLNLSYSYSNEKLIFKLYTGDIDHYRDFSSNNDKIQPNGQILRRLKRLNDHNTKYLTNDKEYAGAIVNDMYLYESGLKIGDVAQVETSNFDLETNTTISSFIDVQIIQSLNFIPGIYNFSNSYESAMIVDVRTVSEIIQDGFLLNSIHLVDFNPKFTVNNTIQNSMTTQLLHDFPNCQIRLYNPLWDQYQNAKPSLEFSNSGYFKLLFVDLSIIGLIIAVELALLITLISNEDYDFNFRLLIRGTGKKGLLRILLTETTIAISIALVFGSFVGFGFGWIMNKVNQITNANSKGYPFPIRPNYPIFADIGKIIQIFASIFGLALLIIFMGYLRNQRKSIAEVNLQK
ncbi:hypothetical protein [Candidatus Lokiarchaeum ossiferum]|uniref:hypothetical protein n=1 Tax=Candidatus Lokiarchaeum ossiferum TaxID=2951803 RepID=UPI00352C325A